MGQLPVIETILIVVIGTGEIALIHQLPADGIEGLLVGVDGHFAVHGQAGENSQLTAAGVAGPQGNKGIVKLNALGGKPVQRGGKLRIDDGVVEGFRGDQDQVLPFKQAGIFIFQSGGQGVQVGVKGFEGVVIFRFCQFTEVQTGNHVGLVYLRLRFFGNGFGDLFFGRFGNRSRGGLGGPFFRRLDNHFRGRLSGLFFGRLRNGFGGRFGGSFGCSFLCEFRGGLLGKHCIRCGGCFGGFRGVLGHGNSCRRGNRGSFGGGLGCRSRGGFCGFLGRGGRGGFRVFLGGGSRDVFQHFRLKNKLKIIHNQTVGLAAQPGQFYKHGNGQTVTLHGVVEIIVGDHGV